MTIKDIIKMVAEDLGKLKVPMSEMQTIAMPIANAIRALNACTEAIERSEAEFAKGTEPVVAEETDKEEV